MSFVPNEAGRGGDLRLSRLESGGNQNYGSIHGPKPYEFIGFGSIHGPKPYEFIGFGYKPKIRPGGTSGKHEINQTPN